MDTTQTVALIAAILMQRTGVPANDQEFERMMSLAGKIVSRAAFHQTG